jgi:hypothetical protein
MVNDGIIFNDAAIAQSHRDNLVVHAGLWVRRIRIDLTMLHLGTCEGIEDFTGMTTDPTIS